MTRIYVITCLIFLPAITNAQQISSYLYNAVPSEHRPANRLHITWAELNNIMVNAKWHIIKDEKAINELDSICIRFATQYNDIADKKERVYFLKNLSNYWIGRLDSYADSILKYCQLFDLETKDGITGFEKLAANVAVSQVFMYTEHIRDYKKAYGFAIRALNIFRQINDSVGMSKSCLLLTGIYAKLGLYEKGANFIDSAKRYDTKVKNSGLLGYKVDFVTHLYLKQYAVAKEKRLADSLVKIFAEYSDTARYPEITVSYTQNLLYLLKAQFYYFHNNYQQCLLNIDTAYKSLKGAVLAAADEVPFKTFKGLSLLRLHKEEGIGILKSVQPKMDEYYTGMVLEELYNYEKKKGNLISALAYHEKMMEYNAGEQLLKHQGQLLEIEQQYNVAARDLQITRLKSQQNKIRFLIILMLCAVFAIIGFILFRQRNNKRKTQQLLTQIDDLTQMQILRIEEAAMQAEEKERKRIGQELHDDLGASLAGLLHYMRTKASRETNPEEKTDMEKACVLLESSYTRTRSSSHDMYYKESEDQFVSMVRDNVNLFFKGTGIEVNADIDDVGMQSLPVNVKTNILLIIKEAIANVIKHAKASKVNLLLYQSNNNIHIEIEDNGTGLSSNLSRIKSVGLISIKKRLQKTNGWLTIDSQIMGGNMLKAVLPAEA